MGIRLDNAMEMQLRFVVVLAMSRLLAGAGQTRANDPPKPDLKPLVAEVRKLVEKHYPKATITLKDQAIHFDYNTRNFMIHDLTRIGDKWQDAHEEPGPQPGGIYCDIELRQGEYGGAAETPQSFNKRYFTVLLMPPYSKKLDHHLYIHLKHPREVPKDFLKEFERLANGFEKHVPARGK